MKQTKCRICRETRECKLELVDLILFIPILKRTCKYCIAYRELLEKEDIQNSIRDKQKERKEFIETRNKALDLKQ